MPNIFLSPATYHNAVQAEDHGFEEELIRPLTDALEPYLKASNIQFFRKSSSMKDDAVIEASNLGEYDLHLAFHVNTGPDCLAGALRGICIFHAPDDQEGARCAKVLAGQLKKIYPRPDLVVTEANDAVEQLTGVSHPSVMLLLGYRDNAADADWLQRSRGSIAASICRAIEEFLNVDTFLGDEDDIALQVSVFSAPGSGAEKLSAHPKDAKDVQPAAAARPRGIVRAPFGGLVIRDAPDSTSSILKTAPNNSVLTILEDLGNWYMLKDGETTGYAKENFIVLL